MNNRLLASAKCAVLALLVVLVASCSKTSELLNYVPADTKFAATVSLGDLIKKSNIKDLNLPDNDEQSKKFVNGDYGFAYDKAVSFEYKDRIFLVLEIDDMDKFEKQMTVETIDNVNVYTDKDGAGFNVAVVDGIAFTGDASKNKMAECVNFVNNLADEARLSSTDIADKLSGHDIDFYVNIGDALAYYASQLEQIIGISNIDKAKSFGYLDFDKNEIKGVMTFVDADGNNLLKAADLGDFDTDMLNLIDANMNSIFALKIKNDILKKAALLAPTNDGITALASQMILANLEGDIAIGVKTKDIQDVYNNSATAVVKLKDGSKDSLRQLIENQLNLKQDATGQYSLKGLLGKDINVGFKDDYLYITNVPLPANTFAKADAANAFDDKTFALFTDISALSEFNPIIPKIDGTSTITLDDKQLSFELHANHNEGNILAYFLKTAINL